MTDKMTVRAIYEDGVLKPLEPLNLPDRKIVDLEIEIRDKEIADFEGILAPYWDSTLTSYDDIENGLEDQKSQSTNRLMQQINGDFDEDDESNE